MTCSSCQQHRINIAKAVKAGDAKKTVTTTIDAARALSENAGRRLVRKFKSPG